MLADDGFKVYSVNTHRAVPDLSDFVPLKNGVSMFLVLPGL